MRKSAAVMALALPLPRLGAAHARAAACAPADQVLAGHYYLHGVMEVGSELLLKPDGRLKSMLAYGALDELASGCWARHGGSRCTRISSKRAWRIRGSSIASIFQLLRVAS